MKIKALTTVNTVDITGAPIAFDAVIVDLEDGTTTISSPIALYLNNQATITESYDVSLIDSDKLGGMQFIEKSTGTDISTLPTVEAGDYGFTPDSPEINMAMQMYVLTKNAALPANLRKTKSINYLEGPSKFNKVPPINLLKRVETINDISKAMDLFAFIDPRGVRDEDLFALDDLLDDRYRVALLTYYEKGYLDTISQGEVLEQFKEAGCSDLGWPSILKVMGLPLLEVKLGEPRVYKNQQFTLSGFITNLRTGSSPTSKKYEIGVFDKDSQVFYTTEGVQPRPENFNPSKDRFTIANAELPIDGTYYVYDAISRGREFQIVCSKSDLAIVQNGSMTYPVLKNFLVKTKLQDFTLSTLDFPDLDETSVNILIQVARNLHAEISGRDTSIAGDLLKSGFTPKQVLSAIYYLAQLHSEEDISALFLTRAEQILGNQTVFSALSKEAADFLEDEPSLDASVYELDTILGVSTILQKKYALESEELELQLQNQMEEGDNTPDTADLGNMLAEISGGKDGKHLITLVEVLLGHVDKVGDYGERLMSRGNNTLSLSDILLTLIIFHKHNLEGCGDIHRLVDLFSSESSEMSSIVGQHLTTKLKHLDKSLAHAKAMDYTTAYRHIIESLSYSFYITDVFKELGVTKPLQERKDIAVGGYKVELTYDLKLFICKQIQDKASKMTMMLPKAASIPDCIKKMTALVTNATIAYLCKQLFPKASIHAPKPEDITVLGYDDKGNELKLSYAFLKDLQISRDLVCVYTQTMTNHLLNDMYSVSRYLIPNVVYDKGQFIPKIGTVLKYPISNLFRSKDFPEFAKVSQLPPIPRFMQHYYHNDFLAEGMPLEIYQGKVSSMADLARDKAYAAYLTGNIREDLKNLYTHPSMWMDAKLYHSIYSGKKLFNPKLESLNIFSKSLKRYLGILTSVAEEDFEDTYSETPINMANMMDPVSVWAEGDSVLKGVISIESKQDAVRIIRVQDLPVDVFINSDLPLYPTASMFAKLEGYEFISLNKIGRGEKVMDVQEVVDCASPEDKAVLRGDRSTFIILDNNTVLEVFHNANH